MQKEALKVKFSLKDKATRALIVGLALVVLGSLLACLVQTSFFTTKIYAKTIETEPVTSRAIALRDESGVSSFNTADIYRPKNASAENPVPLIMVAPGIQRTKETQASFCIELARRGYGVICIDPYAQGESSSSYESQSATNEGYGLFNWIDYMWTDEGREEFSWVDYTRVGACGHSAGGNGCQKLAEREGKLADANRTTSRIQGVYITGYIREWSWKNTRCNVGISYSLNDEGAFQNATAKQKAAILEKRANGETLTEEEEFMLTVGNADLRYADESIALVNFQLTRNGDAKIKEVETSVQYGNQYLGTYCIINNESVLHAFQPYDSETLSHLVEFFDVTMDMGEVHNVASTAQVWWLKEIGCGLALVGGFVFVCALLPLLLRTRAFASVKKTLPSRTANQKVGGRITFWITFVVSATIACLLYMVCVKLSVDWFPEASTGLQTCFFPQRFTNPVMMWAVANGVIGLIIFFATLGVEYLIGRNKAKKQGLPLTSLNDEFKTKLQPLKIDSGKDVLKTLALAAILIGSFYALDYLCYAVFHTDMRFMFISARVTLNWRVVVSVLMYLPLFFIFYFSNSVRVNCAMRPENWKEGLSQVIAVLGNTVGLVAILFIEYVPFVQTGTIGYTSTVGPQWLFVNSLFSIIPMMALLPLANRYFFNKTGRAWLGPIVSCVIFIAMMGGSTTIYYAL